jgi:hypothetical protein
LTDLLIRVTFFPKWRNTVWASESRIGATQVFSGTKKRCETGRMTRLYGGIERSNFSAMDRERGKYLLDYCWTFVCK